MRALPALLGLLLAAAPAAAEVVTDGTAGPRITLSGDLEIGADLGTRAGRNLFHSFERFSLRPGERATFSGPTAIRHVISRVTGGARSDIDGTLASTIPGADLYLINPAGILFGPNASLDLQGSFHVSTADELRFADGAVFSAIDPGASSFTIAAPQAFGFLGAAPAGITLDRAALAVPEGQGLSLIGGDLRLAGASGFADNLRAPGGRIDLASAAAPGEVGLGPDGLDAASVARFGSIRLSGSADLDTTGPGGGSIGIRGGAVVITDGSFVFADNVDGSDATGGIALEADTVTLGSGARVTTDVLGGGRGGALRVAAGRIDLSDGALVSSTTFGAGAGGAITITAREALTISGAGSALRAETGRFSTGAGSEVTVTAPAVELRDGAVISASLFGSGAGGDIALDVGRLMIEGDSVRTEIRTTAVGSGPAGDLVIVADEVIGLHGDGARLFTGTAENSLGTAGDMRLAAGSLEVESGFVSTSTADFSPGPAGDMVIEVGTLVLDDAIVGTSSLDLGPAGDLSILAADRVTIVNGSFVNAFSLGSVPAGTITIRSPELTVSDSLIDAAILTPRGFAPGTGGDVRVEVDRLVVDDGAIIEARTIGFGGAPGGNVSIVARDSVTIAGRLSAIEAGSFGAGRGGQVTITTPWLEVRDGGSVDTAARVDGAGGEITLAVGTLRLAGGGEITARTTGAGDAGRVEIDAGRVLIKGAGSRIVSSSSIAEGAPVVPERLGDGNSITITADRLTLGGGGEISSSATRRSAVAGLAGDAGDITIVAADRLEMDRAAITTEAQQSGGGRISVTVGERIDLRASRIASSVTGDDTTTAGDITIDPRFLVLDGSRIVAQADAGRGGGIQITADNLIASPDSVISASAERGIDGTVVISTPEVDLSGGLVVLDSALVEIARVGERCAARRDIGASSFTPVGHGALPPSPDGPLASSSLGPAEVAPAGARLAALAAAERAGRPASQRPLALLLPCPAWRETSASR